MRHFSRAHFEIRNFPHENFPKDDLEIFGLKIMDASPRFRRRFSDFIFVGMIAVGIALFFAHAFLKFKRNSGVKIFGALAAITKTSADARRRRR